MTGEVQNGDVVDKSALRWNLYCFVARCNHMPTPTLEALAEFLVDEDIVRKALQASRLLDDETETVRLAGGGHEFDLGVWVSDGRPQELWLKTAGRTMTGVGLAHHFDLALPVTPAWQLDQSRLDQIRASYSLNVPGQALFQRSHGSERSDPELVKTLVGMSVNELDCEFLTRRIY